MEKMKRIVKKEIKLVVIKKIEEKGEREVIEKRMEIKEIVSKDEEKVRMEREKNEVNIVGIEIIKLREEEERKGRRKKSILVRMKIEEDEMVMERRKKMVEEIEEILEMRIIEEWNIGKIEEMEMKIVKKESKKEDEDRKRKEKSKLEIRKIRILDRVEEKLNDIEGKLKERLLDNFIN